MLCGTKATRDYSDIRRFILDSEVGLMWKEGSDSVKEGVRLVEHLQHKQGSRAAAASLIRSLQLRLAKGLVAGLVDMLSPERGVAISYSGRKPWDDASLATPVKSLSGGARHGKSALLQLFSSILER